MIRKGIDLVVRDRYFTIWAPRQSGKSTYFRFLAEKLKLENYKAVYFSVEGFDDYTTEDVFDTLNRELNLQAGIKKEIKRFKDLEKFISTTTGYKLVLIIDEVEGLNPAILNQFLHTIRNLYHSRENHCLKSVILVGVSNIVGVIQDNASPFNIADNLDLPYFTKTETFELTAQHELETGQRFEEKTKEKIHAITSGQPGLVNGFAYKLVEWADNKKIIDYDDYLKVEDWYLTEAIDKNIANIINKAKEHRNFVEKLLFTEEKEKFKINDEKIKFLHTHGLIEKDNSGYVGFWVPLYRKAIYDAFYPYSNGEKKEQMQAINLSGFFKAPSPPGVAVKLDYDRLIAAYRTYVKRRGFRYFREKDESGNWKQIKEAAVVYSFESFIQALLQMLGGKSYLEPHAGQGNSDMIVNIAGKEIVFEFKVFRDQSQFEKGKKQVAYYSKSLDIDECIYVVFISSIYKGLAVKDEVLQIDGVTVRCYPVFFDEGKDF